MAKTVLVQSIRRDTILNLSTFLSSRPLSLTPCLIHQEEGEDSPDPAPSVTSPRELYKHLHRQTEKLPQDAKKFYQDAIRRVRKNGPWVLLGFK